MTNEQQTDTLDSIAAEAATDATLAPPPQVEVAATAGDMAAPVDYDGEAAELVEFAFDSLSPLYPSIVPIYTPDIRAKLAQRTGALMQKYGFTMGDVFAKWMPEIGFAMTVLPLIGKTVIAVKNDNAAARKAAELAQPAPTETPMQPIIDKTDPGSLHNKI